MKRTIFIPTYSIHLDVYLCKDDKESDKQHSKLMSKFGYKGKQSHDAKATTYALYKTKKRKVQAVLFNNSKGTDVAVCSHEALHCVFNIMKHVDIEICSKSEEAFTYLQGFITQSIADSICELKQKIK